MKILLNGQKYDVSVAYSGGEATFKIQSDMEASEAYTLFSALEEIVIYNDDDTIRGLYMPDTVTKVMKNYDDNSVSVSVFAEPVRKTELIEMKNSLILMEQKNTELTTRIGEQETTLNEYCVMLESQANTIASHKTTMDEMNETISAQAARITELEQQNAELNEAVLEMSSQVYA